MSKLHIELVANEATFVLVYDEIIKRQRRLPPEQREQLEVVGRQLLDALGEEAPEREPDAPETMAMRISASGAHRRLNRLRRGFLLSGEEQWPFSAIEEADSVVSLDRWWEDFVAVEQPASLIFSGQEALRHIALMKEHPHLIDDVLTIYADTSELGVRRG